MYLDAVWDGEWGRSSDACIRWGGDRRRGGAVLGVNLGRPTVMGLRDAALPKLLWAVLVSNGSVVISNFRILQGIVVTYS